MGLSSFFLKYFHLSLLASFFLSFFLAATMSQKVSPSMQSLKSLPADYRFDGENSIVGLTNSSIPRKGGSRNGVSSQADTAPGDSEDSPYSRHGVSAEEQSLTDDVEPGAAPIPLPQSDERRWSDTSAYTRKKVGF